MRVRKTRFEAILAFLLMVVATILIVLSVRYLHTNVLKVLALIGCVIFITSRAH